MSIVRDVLLATRARRAGAQHSLRIVREARAAGVPISWAFALVEQESSFRNVFGHDRGSILHGQDVTHQRVTRLLQFVRRGGNSNGVGLTQLTWPPLIKKANALGGAEIVKYQLRVGFDFFADVTLGNYDRNAWRYNGSPAYQAKIAAAQRRWHVRLT